VYVWMDGCMDGWMDGWMDIWMYLDGHSNELMDGWMDVKMDGMDYRMRHHLKPCDLVALGVAPPRALNVHYCLVVVLQLSSLCRKLTTNATDRVSRRPYQTKQIGSKEK
jgi:hypothetical protein